LGFRGAPDAAAPAACSPCMPDARPAAPHAPPADPQWRAAAAPQRAAAAAPNACSACVLRGVPSCVRAAATAACIHYQLDLVGTRREVLDGLLLLGNGPRERQQGGAANRAFEAPRACI
jgi:hypothetical protein